jgi:hypothetical protein
MSDKIEELLKELIVECRGMKEAILRQQPMPPMATAPAYHAGCVCPLGFEHTSGNWNCPRRSPSFGPGYYPPTK